MAHAKTTKTRLSQAAVVAGLTAAVMGLAAFTVNTPAALAAESSGADSTFIVNVNAIKISVMQVNSTVFNNNDEADSIAVRTYDAKNHVHFKTDSDAYVKLVMGDKVLWEGETKADQPVSANFDLGKTSVGIYNISIRAYDSKDETDHYSRVFFHLDYRATIPSIIPDNGNNNIYDNGGVKAPNTGMYVTIGGRIYSMSTVALVVLLTAVAIFLICSKYGRQEPAVAKAASKSAKSAKAKTTRKKMDLI